MEQVSIQFLANSGVAVQYGLRRFLVDGIYGKNRFFTPPLKEIQKAVFGMDSPYRDMDYVLHTHRHTDHFSAAYLDEYAANNAVRRIFVPRSGPDPQSFLEDRAGLPKATRLGVLQEVELEPGQHASWQLETDCAVTYCRCRHLDHGTYPAVLHCAVLLTLGDRQLLFAADADPSEENAALFSSLGPLSAVFITPLFFVHPDGRKMLQRLAPKRIVLYHIPFAVDDSTGLRPLAEREVANYGPDLPSLVALTEPNQLMLL